LYFFVRLPHNPHQAQDQLHKKIEKYSTCCINSINGLYTILRRIQLVFKMASSCADIPVAVLTGNEKRKQSCKNVGGEKKRKGHKREDDFKNQYNPASLTEATEYKATSDTWIPSGLEISNILCERFGIPASKDLYISNKSGENIQFTLGQIPELIAEDNLAWLQNADNCRALFNKYLKKVDSAKPADILVYKDNTAQKWIFFKMDDIIDFIVAKATWRRLETGRIKGDFDNDTKKGSSQYLTYEYRTTHKSYFLGLNGGKGIEFIHLLKKNIAFYEDAFHY
jgi:hypothetical protein